VVKIKFIVMFIGNFIKSPFDQLPVSVNVDVKILVKLDNALENPRLSLYGLSRYLEIVDFIFVASTA
jgi:hypothetical protein